jgi:hypothetical protein
LEEQKKLRQELLKQNRKQGIDINDYFYQDGSLLTRAGGNIINQPKGKEGQILTSKTGFPTWNYRDELLVTDQNIELTDNDNYSTVIFTNNTTNRELKLPLAINNPNRKLYIISKSNTNYYNIKTQKNDYIHRTYSPTQSLWLNKYDDYITLQSNGGNVWYIVKDKRTIASRYSTNAGQIIVNGAAIAVINYEDKTFDIYDNVAIGAAWKFTCDIPGIYRVSIRNYTSTVAWAVGDYSNISLCKNGISVSNLSYYYNTVADTYAVYHNGTDIIRLVYGDIIDVRMGLHRLGGNITLLANTLYNYICIEKIGN